MARRPAPARILTVLPAGRHGRDLVAARSPLPVKVTVPGQPAPPGGGASSYQQARYREAVLRWRQQVTAGKRAVIARTTAETTAWSRGLPLRAGPGGPPRGRAAARLPEECAQATNAVTGLIDQAGSRVGGRRVILLSVTSLAGMPPAGELDGDDVIVTTSFVPTAAAASAAQQNLLVAGAADAAIVGPEVTATRLDQLVSAGLSQRSASDDLSGKALFANDSSALLPTAVSVLAPLAGQLRRPDARAIINGYASAPGSARHNQWLSQHRAAAVAAFFEARGVPKARLSVVGHGATDLVGPGASGDNRRVIVVIEEPAEVS